MLKKIAKRIISPLLLMGRDWHWQTRKAHVLIESLQKFMIEDWLERFNRCFPDWTESIEIKSFRNFAERDALISETNIYIGAWFSPELLSRAPELRLIQMVTAGVEFLNDLEVTDRVRITTSSSISSQSVAEHVLMLMLALDRRLDVALTRQKHWRWDTQEIARQAEFLNDRTAGIVGLGNNGKALANILLEIGMQVIGYDVRSDIHVKGVKLCTAGLSELLALADFVILCVPLTGNTKKMIGSKELDQMKRSACLVNVARGGIIDEHALARALKKRIIAGAGLDVLSQEPLPLLHPLRNCPNLIITPHIAGNINAHREAIMKRMVMNVQALINNQNLEGVYNPVPGNFQGTNRI